MLRIRQLKLSPRRILTPVSRVIQSDPNVASVPLGYVRRAHGTPTSVERRRVLSVPAGGRPAHRLLRTVERC